MTRQAHAMPLPHARAPRARGLRRLALAVAASASTGALKALLTGLLTILLAGVLTGVPSAQAAPPPSWVLRLRAELAHIDTGGRPDIGVHVRDLDSGLSVSWRADETWYLASTIKLPVALTVLQQVQRQVFALDTPVTLRAADYVDGAGSTNRQPVGARPTVRWLLEQMMVYSDNTATDMLIGLVGLRSVNERVRQVVPAGFQPITSMADARRHIYGGLTPAAVHLSGHDFLQLKAQRTDPARRQLLSHLLQVPAADFRMATVADAYDAYYASGLNSGRLDAYGDLLAHLAQGDVLDAAHTAWLLALMERAKTGQKRIRAGLPHGVRWAHKTGTQFARTCDSGVISVPRPGRDQRVVVAACTRGDRSLASAERALLQVGAAICRSGLLGAGRPLHDLPCRTEPAHLSTAPTAAREKARETARESARDAAVDAAADADAGLR